VQLDDGVAYLTEASHPGDMRDPGAYDACSCTQRRLPAAAPPGREA
jgi:hypothetical protein